MTFAVHALLTPRTALRELAAGFEEEGVPLRCETATGNPFENAREAARRSPLGLGVGGDGERLVLVLTGAAGDPYLEAPARDARAFGHAVARVAARRPLHRATPPSLPSDRRAG